MKAMLALAATVFLAGCGRQPPAAPAASPKDTNPAGGMTTVNTPSATPPTNNPANTNGGSTNGG